MADADSCVTIHMAASLDGFIARKDGSVDWLETTDEFEGGETLDPEYVETFLAKIDCYVMGSRTYETALDFEAKGFGWPYGAKPTFVLTSRELPKSRDTVEFYSGDLRELVNGRLKPTFRSIWFVGGGAVSGEVGIHFAPVTATGCVHRPGAGGRGQRPSGRPAERGGRRAARGPSRSVD